MWKYNYTNEMYDGKSELYHSKYLRKYMAKSGKMVYVYPNRLKNNKGKIKVDSKTNYNDGKGNYQHSTEIYNDKTKNGIGLFRGSNKDHKYAGISIGAPKENYKYKEKQIKIGNKTLYIHNDNGTFNAEIHSKRKNK